MLLLNTGRGVTLFLSDSQGNNGIDGQPGTDSWVKLPNGLILQWGTTPVSNGEQFLQQKFSIPFTTACLHVSLSTQIDSYGGDRYDEMMQLCSFDTTGFNYQNQSFHTYNSRNLWANWIAIGY